MKRNITRCVCHQRTFEELKAYCHECDIKTTEELVERRLCGCGCAMCLPYVQLMLQTGETAFKPGAFLVR